MITLKGRYFVTLYGPDGAVKDYREGDNVVTTVGKEFMASFLSSAAAGAATFTAKYAAIGTNDTAEAAADTALGTEAARHTGTVSYVSGAIYKVTATFAAGTGTGAITEYGLFSTSTGGTLVSRDTESVINKGASDTLTVVYNLTLS
jgi:basic membrane lipoprotein Med (substrate-binding protein (PBP1-ABC) superfamily)